jgi:hypothetical protein
VPDPKVLRVVLSDRWEAGTRRWTLPKLPGLTMIAMEDAGTTLPPSNWNAVVSVKEPFVEWKGENQLPQDPIGVVKFSVKKRQALTDPAVFGPILIFIGAMTGAILTYRGVILPQRVTELYESAIAAGCKAQENHVDAMNACFEDFKQTNIQLIEVQKKWKESEDSYARWRDLCRCCSDAPTH